uniref:alpha-N-acetylgalactosaminide alpha-2,6-sialyltransferase 2-like n=1 Tax=Myxine glutinosa TaxID=7769 RepID=UPI00358E3545
MWSPRVCLIGSVFLLFFTIGFFRNVDFKSLQRSLLQSAELKERELTTTTQPQQFTTASWLGDSYSSETALYSASECPSKLQQKLEQLKWDGGAFLSTVPVLQWAPHATQDLYNRLRHYVGCMGWPIKFDDLKEALSLLNSTANGVMFDKWREPVKREKWSKRGAPPSSACVRCAVVGNGGILRKAGRGSEIDKHDYVFRMNGALLHGFEEDVGTRTSFYFFSTNTMRNSLAAYSRNGFVTVPISEETRFVFIPDHDRDFFMVTAAVKGVLVEKGREKGINPSKLFGPNLTAEKFKMVHPDFSRYLRNRLLPAPIMKSKSRNIYRPSTGGFALLTALYTCDEVSAYGFLTENYANFSNHYYDKTYKKTGFYANHNYNKEMKLWRRLHDVGAISLFMRNNTDVGLLHKS